jgi:hypothetical protein
METDLINVLLSNRHPSRVCQHGKRMQLLSDNRMLILWLFFRNLHPDSPNNGCFDASMHSLLSKAFALWFHQQEARPLIITQDILPAQAKRAAQ